MILELTHEVILNTVHPLIKYVDNLNPETEYDGFIRQFVVRYSELAQRCLPMMLASYEFCREDLVQGDEMNIIGHIHRVVTIGVPEDNDDALEFLRHFSAFVNTLFPNFSRG